MFYIVRELCFWNGGLTTPFRAWYVYTIKTSKPSSREYFVKIDRGKNYLKQMVKEKERLHEALEFLFNSTIKMKKLTKLLNKLRKIKC